MRLVAADLPLLGQIQVPSRPRVLVRWLTSSSVVTIRAPAPSCQKDLEGSGFVVSDHTVMSNAHVVAGSNKIFYEIATGNLTWVYFLRQFLVPTLIDNTLGGVSLVAFLGHAQVVAGKEM